MQRNPEFTGSINHEAIRALHRDLRLNPTRNLIYLDGFVSYVDISQ